MKYQQHLSFNKSLNHSLLIKMLIDPVLMIITLYFLTIYFENKLTSQYIVLSILLFALSFPGRWLNSKNFKNEFLDTFGQWFLIVGVLFFFGYATDYLNRFSHQVILFWVSLTPIILITSHLMASKYLSSKHYISRVKKTAVIIGVNNLGNQLQDRINSNTELGIELKGFFDVLSEGTISHAQLLGSVQQVSNYVKKNTIDIIYIALPPSLHSEIMLLLDDLKDTTASIYFVPHFFMADLIQARIDDIGGMPIVAVCETPFSGFDGFVKGLSDVIISSLILCLISPLLILLGLGVKLTSPGPILFKQRRYGLDGHEIIVYKFRSMTVAEDGETVTQAKMDDKRVTRFGKFIRKTSLDELPQFINVLQGTMSIVGPRPHAISHNEMYRKLIKGYMIRHKVKPGITGWAQVNGFRGETETVDNMKARIDYDIDYLKKWSLGMDIKIILKTVLLIFKDSKAY
ncbi:undecaprenyl-phosphate glucose phosphotransferase [Methylotenera sp.]|uniref:undecaprenyl-phosphate glucose phosphotransferase n=1 Tax=Methylotenera sp. TaxID=2051956 RepID=UPI002730F3E5|nr:undecaprenyl-phosphate glucose phosphotransferase [Methylotenera sp.]MDP2071320.1 undecaprenyl-phosphate glucose phosphotransferase [Methylotenera sp.]MDP2229667.1 undecaprenyl-phosphate glucose phosphotransferase [Methylotenera sp.]MDP3005237.1 undecaprenyl-phosphate glucose phosphotransferase [Methylotenera sp.]MDP3818139.1 undecaprenyl-phosphate glucose phosphotransferase [Methylotenera sp.]